LRGNCQPDGVDGEKHQAGREIGDAISFQGDFLPAPVLKMLRASGRIGSLRLLDRRICATCANGRRGHVTGRMATWSLISEQKD
jgi:hypothetical protein